FSVFIASRKKEVWLDWRLFSALLGVSLFLASPRKSKQKEGDPRVGARCAGPLRYSAVWAAC
ncbi:MAG: hypothetical protein WAW48_14920, partial [Azonexus sp.]